MTAQHPSRTGPCRWITLAVVLLSGAVAHASSSDEALEALMQDFWEA